MSARVRRAVIAATAGLIALGVALSWPRASSGLGTLLRWERGQEHRYRFTYTSKDNVGFLGVSGAGMSGTFEVAGDLVVRALGADGGVDHLAVRLDELTAQRFEVQGQSLVTSDEARAALVGPSALVLMEPSGVVRGMELPAKAPALFRHTLTALFAQGAFELRPSLARWETVEAGPRGEAQADYAVAEARLGGWTVKKSVRRFTRLRAIPLAASAWEQQVNAPTSIVLGRSGQLQSLDGEEHLVATSGSQTLLQVDATLKLALVAVTRFEPGADPVATLRADSALEPPVRLDQPAESREAKLATLTRITRGLERAQLLELLRLVSEGQRLPPDFFWRAAAFLELHPEVCAEVAALFTEAESTSALRQAITTLLVSTGTPEAQARLRELLRSEAAAKDPQLPAMVTTLTFLRKPAPETVALLEHLDATTQGPLRVAATYALGAEVGSAYRAGEREFALDADRRLLDALRAAPAPERQRELLTALGNAGLAENIREIGALESSPDPAVRSAVANALRKTQAPDSESLLLRLVTDPNQPVQAAALEALREFELRAELLITLASLVRAGQVDERSFPTVLNLVGRGQTVRAFPQEVRALLEAMLATPIQRTEIREAISQQLRALSGG